MAEALSWASVPNIPRIMVEFAAGTPAVMALLGGDWREKAVRRAVADSRLGARRPEGLGSAVRKSLAGVSLPPAVQRNLELLDRPDCLAVVTGQQVGIFGGANYTFFKAWTAVQLADALAAEAPGPVVPVFWMETGDADFAEVNRVNFPQVDTTPRRGVYLPSDLVLGRSLSRHVLSAEIAAVTDAVCGWMKDTPGGGALAEVVRRCYHPGKRLAEAFTELMTTLLGHRGLVMFDPLHPELASRAAGFWEAALERPERLNHTFAVSSSEVQNLHLPLQVKLRPDTLPILHLDEEGFRRRIIKGDGEYWCGKDGPRMTLDQLRREAQQRPGALTPSALLRPLMQDYLLPTWIYVAGPAETSYNAQIGRCYDAMSLPRPLLAPRLSATMVERRERRLLDRHGWTVKDVLGGREIMLAAEGRSQVLKDLFDSGADQLSGWLERIGTVSEEAGVNIGMELDQAGRKLRYQWEKLRRTALNRLIERDRVRADHAQHLIDRLTPDRMLQERHDSPLYYIAHYGGDFQEILASEADLFQTAHMAIDIGEGT